MGVSYLFVDNEQKHSTTKWYKLLSCSPLKYEHCQLVSLTCAQALNSPVTHEFIQFIVEDTRNERRTRVFSDRTDVPEPHRVIIRRDWGSDMNPSKQRDLHLPLKSLVFTRPGFCALPHLVSIRDNGAPVIVPYSQHHVPLVCQIGVSHRKNRVSRE